MNTEIMTTGTQALELQRAEIDTQIATAKSYPRDLEEFKEKCETMIAITPDIAASCCYHLEKGGKAIEGPSIRLAEIMLTNWKNLRIGAKVLEEGAEFVIIQGACHDLESNVAVQVEVKRRITTKNGKRFGPDMIQTTTAAATSIAIRNAFFKVAPNVYTQHFLDMAKKASVGPQDQFSARVKNALLYFSGFGLSEDRILDKLGISKKTQINTEHLTVLQGIRTAIKDQMTTIQNEFPEPMREPQPATTPTETENKNAATGDENAVPPDEFIDGVDVGIGAE